MLKILKSVRSAKKKYGNHLNLISANSFIIFGNQLLYAILPVLFAVIFNEWVAGLIIGALNIMQAFLLNPVFDSLSDRHGSKPMMMIGIIAALLASIIWMAFSSKNMVILLGFSFFLFASYTLKGVSEAYMLRISKRNCGGFVFGLSEDVYAVAYFLVTMLIPFFLVSRNQYLAGLVLFISSIVALLLVMRLPSDKAVVMQALQARDRIKNGKVRGGLTSVIRSLNPIPAFRNGFHFVRMNKYIPMLILCITLFESIFYGTIWFVFPLHIAKIGGNFSEGMILGVYEIVTIVLAAFVGYMADKYNWKKIFMVGWSCISLGAVLLPFFDWPIWLIIVGFIIAFGDNLAAFSSYHLLELKDIDHCEDGSFIALKYLISDISYAVAPIVAGFLYYSFGFRVSLILPAIVAVFCAFMVMRFVFRIKANPTALSHSRS